MSNIYDFVGGRKMFVAYLLFVLSGALWFFNREITADQLFRFWEFITLTLVIGNVASKFSENAKRNQPE